MNIMKIKRKVNVSDVAYFVDDPIKYIKFEGKAYNPRAAEYGTKYHETSLGGKFSTIKVLGFIFLCISIATIIYIVSL
jgi:hypothetical protein